MGIKKILAGSASIPLLILFGILAVYFLFLPPVLKWVIEKQGEKQLGRKVEVGYTTFNLFRGSFNMHKFRIYEPDGKQLFVSFRKFYVNLNIPDLFRQVYHVESVGLEEPVIHITQADSTFNFSDILARFSGQDDPEEITNEDTASSGPLKYIIENLSVTTGLVSYSNPDFKLQDTMISLNLHFKRVAWDDPVIESRFSFGLAGGGDFRGHILVNTTDQSMILNDTIVDFNLSNYKHYLDPYLLAGSLEGFLHTSNRVEGNASTFDLKLTGNIRLTDLALKDSSGGLVAGFGEFSVMFDRISFSEDMLSFDTISLIRPVIHYVMTPGGDNISAMLPDEGESDTLANGQPGEPAYGGQNPLEMMVSYLQESLNTYLLASYRINQLIIDEGKITYHDLTLQEPFIATIDSLHFSVSNLTTNVERSYGRMSAVLNKEGRFMADISVDPRNLLNMDLKYELSSLMIPDFNPFSVYYLAYPFPRGAFNYRGSLVIENRVLTSENNLLIEKIYVGEKVKNNTATSLPIKLAIALLRNREGDIRLNVPVSGDLNDPKVRIGRLILEVLKNIIVKAATAPYDLLASAFGGNEEDYKDLRYEYRQVSPGEKEQKQLNSIAAILTDKPELTVTFTQFVDTEREKADLAVWETKKIYWFDFVRNEAIPAKLNEEDSLTLTGINPETDLYSFFAAKLDGTLAHLSTAEKCFHIAGIDRINKISDGFTEARNQALRDFLAGELLIPQTRFLVLTASGPADAPPDYPYFSIKFDVKE